MYQRNIKSSLTPIHNYMTFPNFAIMTIGTGLAGWYLWDKVLPYKNKEIFEAFEELESSRDDVRLHGVSTLHEIMKKDKYARERKYEHHLNRYKENTNIRKSICF